MNLARPALALTLVAVLACALASPAPASAAMKRCAGVTGHPGGNATWRVDRIRLTKGFSCNRARRNIKTWIGFGGMMDNAGALAPWRCRFGTAPRCTLRSTYGGTRPLRTYHLRFRVRSA